jgi:hypothetical protein
MRLISQTAEEPPAPRLRAERAAEFSPPSAEVLGYEGSQVHKDHNVHLMSIPWAFSREPSSWSKVHIFAEVFTNCRQLRFPDQDVAPNSRIDGSLAV